MGSFLTFAALSSIALATAQTVQDSWISPAAPDFASTLTIGQLYDISWQSDLLNDFATYAPSEDVSNVDLWITDYNLHIYSSLIAARQNLNTISSISWRVQLSADALTATDQWVFRWLPQGVSYSATNQQISSPGFYVQNVTTPSVTTSSGGSSTTTSTSASSTSSTTTSTSSTASLSQASPTSENTTSSTTAPTTSSAASTSSTPLAAGSSSGLSTGAKAGIAIGAVAGGALLLGAGWFLARRFGRGKNQATSAPTMSGPTRRQDAIKEDAFRNSPYTPAATSQPQLSEIGSSNQSSAPAYELPGHRV